MSDLAMVKHMGTLDYALSLEEMQDFTARRNEQTPDEIWLCQHPPVFTHGLASKPEHLL
jgi:lipoyl(octanoyl) transferase